MPVLPLVESIKILPGVNLAGALSVENHVQSRAVFHGTARVQELSFSQDLNSGKPGKGDLDERRTPNLVEQPEPVCGRLASAEDISLLFYLPNTD